MSVCACGCGETTRGGDFKPGHDAKLRARLEERVGGLLNLERLVLLAEEYAGGQITVDNLGEQLQQLFGGN